MLNRLQNWLGLSTTKYFYPPKGCRLIVIMRLIRARNEYWHPKDFSSNNQDKRVSLYPFVGEIERINVIANTKPFAELIDSVNLRADDGHDDVYSKFKLYYEGAGRVYIKVNISAHIAGFWHLLVTPSILSIPATLLMLFGIHLFVGLIVLFVISLFILLMILVKVQIERKHALKWLKYVLEQPLTIDEEAEFSDVLNELDKYDLAQIHDHELRKQGILFNGSGYPNYVGSGEVLPPVRSDGGASYRAFRKAVKKMESKKRDIE